MRAWGWGPYMPMPEWGALEMPGLLHVQHSISHRHLTQLVHNGCVDEGEVAAVLELGNVGKHGVGVAALVVRPRRQGCQRGRLPAAGGRERTESSSCAVLL